MRRRAGRALLRRGLAALFVLLALTPGAAAQEEDAAAQAGAAEELTAQCTLTASFVSRLTRLTDGDKESAQRIGAGESVTISWTEEVPVEAVYLSFYYAPAAYTVIQRDAAGATLAEEAGALLWNEVIEPVSGAQSVTIAAGEEEIALGTLAAYGAGAVADYLPWELPPEKADYLLVAMHPDDDALFLGAVIPIYGAEQGREGAAVYLASRVRQRVDEALRGAWTMGLRAQPVFGGFPDIPNEYRSQFENTFRSADVVQYLVRQMRRLKPEVVVSQDLNGEYGHWQHVLLANAVLEAAPLAADAAYDPESAEQYGAWEVKKVYLHLYPENRIQLPVTEPLAAFDGRTAVEVAAEAFACHESQLPSRHAVTNEGIYSLSDFGLAYTTVGADTPGVNDMFEHIDPAVLHAAATPEPTATPAETAEPTATPAPAATPEPTATPGATPEAAETPTAGPETGGTDGLVPALLIGLIALVLAALVALAVRQRRARRRNRRRRTGTKDGKGLR